MLFLSPTVFGIFCVNTVLLDLMVISVLLMGQLQNDLQNTSRTKESELWFVTLLQQNLLQSFTIRV